MSQFHIVRLMKYYVTIFSATFQAMLFKLGKRMNKNLLYVLEKQDPGSCFPLHIKSGTFCWLSDLIIYCCFYLPALLEQPSGAIGISSDSSSSLLDF